jgi:hypothetical protein
MKYYSNQIFTVNICFGCARKKVYEKQGTCPILSTHPLIFGRPPLALFPGHTGAWVVVFELARPQPKAFAALSPLSPPKESL